MRNYWISFFLITVLGFCWLGTIIFKNFIQKPQPQLFYLNTDSMQMASSHVTDSASRQLQVVSIFPCNTKNAAGKAIPWADLYVCRSYNKADSLSGDTAQLFIDVHTNSDLNNIKDPDHYGIDIKTSQNFKKCMVMVPANQISAIRKYRYRFAQVTLVDDDWMSD